LKHERRNEVLYCVITMEKQINEVMDYVHLPDGFITEIFEKIGSDISDKSVTKYCHLYITSKRVDGYDDDVICVMVGRLLADISAEYITNRFKLGYILSTETDSTIQHFETLITNMTHACDFSTVRDMFMDLGSASKLCCERLAYMARRERPRYQSAKQYPGVDLNELTRPYIDVGLSERVSGLDFEGSTKIDDFLFLVCVLCDMVDHFKASVYIGPHISFYGGKSSQFFVVGTNFDVVSAGFGILDGDQMLRCAEPHGISRLLLYFLRKSRCDAFLECCDDPDNVQKKNIYRKYVYS